MALIKKHTSGHIEVNSTAIAEHVSVTMTLTLNTADTTAIGEAWEDSIALHKGWELAVTCNYSPQDTGQAIVVAASVGTSDGLTGISFYEDATGVYTASAGILTAYSVTRAIGSPDKLNFSIRGKAPLAHTAGST
jgi:hypothetical protein